MCTVTFIPRGKDNFVLTSNRDENAARSPGNITEITEKNFRVLFPRDTEAGGTWIAASGNNSVVCLLNGAFERHQRELPYKYSRGLMVLDFFSFPNAPAFFSQYDFKGLEPFTMIIYDNGQLTDLRWDGKKLHQFALDTRKYHIWSSATLYDRSIREKREQWFADWLKGRSDFSLNAILDFHRHAGEGDPLNDVMMNRNGIVQTVSITHIVKTPNQVEMYYHDLISDQFKQAKIQTKGEVVASR